MPSVRLHRVAEQEVAAAADWYEEQHPGLGVQFLTEVERAMEAIAERPGPGRSGRERDRTSASVVSS